MSHSLTDLAGLRVSAEDFLAAVLETAAQPIWVVDAAGLIRFANPAAIAALGYDSADELFGRHSHETIHYRHPDGSPYPAADCPMLLPRATGETVASDLDWFFRRDGSMFPVSYVSVPLEMLDGRGAVVAFTDIEDRLRSEQVLRDHEAVLATQQASLRRVATLVARGAASEDVFATIAREVAHVLGVPTVEISRYEPDGTATVRGAWGERTHAPQASAPIVVDGDVWGVIAAGATEPGALPGHVEERLAELTELVATAISSTASREELARLAEEQAALRRVATLVAHESSPAEVFAAVAEEVGGLLSVRNMRMVRYETDATVTVVAEWGERDAAFPVGTRLSLGGENIASLVLRSGRAARIDYAEATGEIGAYAREAGDRSAVGTPILVEGRLWGVMVATSPEAEPLPADTEARIREFTELVATAISNIEARSELAASRARVVAAADQERRRVVRDLHDGAQQRLVHTVITLKMARRALEAGEAGAAGLVGEGLEQAERAMAELRELVHGILPAVLTRGGLAAGAEALASRMSVPVEIAVSVDRLPAAVEATAYFVVAEALTNVAKHSGAQRATVTARVEHGTLSVEVRDDGVGGALEDGSGLVGLADRLAALDGRLRVESPPGRGTLVAAHIPTPAPTD